MTRPQPDAALMEVSTKSLALGDAATQLIGGLKMVLKRALACLFVLTLASGVLLAQSSDLKVAHTTHSGPITPSAKPSPKLTTIFSNLGPTSTDAYNDTTGYYILGPDNSVGLPEQGIGVPFIPAANSHVEQLQVAVGWESGTSLVNVGLYSDNAGVVGTLLSTGHAATIPVFGTCCQLVTVNIKSTAVTAKTQYWIVVTSDDTNAPDFTGVFAASNLAIIGGDVGLTGWFSFTTNTPAAAARGSVP